MDIDTLITERVAGYYWQDDINCTRTMLKILSEHFRVALNEQLYHAAVGMHGAGGYGAQCGLVEGSLLFIGLYATPRKYSEEQICQTCRAFAQQFESRFGSLQCKVLRPERFSPDNPPHLCEPLTRDAVLYSIRFIESFFEGSSVQPGTE